MRMAFVTKQKGEPMNDLIDRKAAIDAVNVGNLHPGIIKSLKSIIEEIPSAEPRKGKWVDVVELDSGGYPFKVGVCCSVCGAPTLIDYNYCPHCGAKMEVTE